LLGAKLDGSARKMLLGALLGFHVHPMGQLIEELANHGNMASPNSAVALRGGGGRQPWL
jgi:hypothetical protein